MSEVPQHHSINLRPLIFVRGALTEDVDGRKGGVAVDVPKEPGRRRACVAGSLQGYLAHGKWPDSLGLPNGPRQPLL